MCYRKKYNNLKTTDYTTTFSKSGIERIDDFFAIANLRH